MKRTSLIGCLLILNIAFSQAVFLKKPSSNQFTVFSQLQKIENNSFGKQMMDTVALQITNKVPLADVAQVIREIKNDLVDQQSSADQLHSERSAECTSEDERLTNLIADATNVRNDSQENLNILNADIQTLQDSIANKDKQLEILSERVSNLQSARLRDADAYATRVNDSNQVLEALNLIVEKLGGIHAEETPSEVFLQLAKIGNSNPILSLVSVASTFSQESLNNVLSKLNGLVDSLNASLKEDLQAENQALNDFNSLSSELQSNIGSLTSLRSSLAGELSQKQASHSFHTGRYNNAVDAIASNTELLSNKRDQCANWENTYTSQSASRSNEIQLVEQVQNIIATKLETMKDYLKNRSEQ